MRYTDLQVSRAGKQRTYRLRDRGRWMHLERSPLLPLLVLLEDDRVIEWEERRVTRVHLLGHVLLPTIVLGRLFFAQVDDHEEICPRGMGGWCVIGRNAPARV